MLSLPTTVRIAPNLFNLLRRAGSSTKHFCSDKTAKDAGNSDSTTNCDVSKLLEESANYNEASDTSWATLPYPEGALSRLQEEKPERPKTNPSDTSIILFPGQGTIKVGAVKEYLRFPVVKDLYECVNEALGYDLLKLCLKGPQRTLNRTEHNQPAVVALSLAALEKLREERPQAIEKCVAAAGYSVGELTALIFAGVMTVEAGIRLVAVRGTAMQEAAAKSPQGMMFVHTTPEAKVVEACKKAKSWAMDLGVAEPECRIAIYLYTQAKILAGSEEALMYIQKNHKSFGLRQLRKLPVSGAFHTSLMEPALKPFLKALHTVDLKDPILPVFSNYTGRQYSAQKNIIKCLVKQIISPVKWEQIMHELYGRPQGMAFPRTFDVGSQGALKSILKQVNAKAWDTSFTI